MPIPSTPAEKKDVWTVLLLGAVVWTAVALLVAVVVGRGVRLADERAPGTGLDAVLTTESLNLAR